MSVLPSCSGKWLWILREKGEFLGVGERSKLGRNLQTVLWHLLVCELITCPKLPSKRSLFEKVKFHLCSKNSEPDREGKNDGVCGEAGNAARRLGPWKGFRRCVMRHGNVCHFSWMKSKDLAGWAWVLALGSGKYRITCEPCILCCPGSPTIWGGGRGHCFLDCQMQQLDDEKCGPFNPKVVST